MRFRSKLTVQILTGVVVAFAVLCGLVSYIGYCEFTEALEDQYEARAYSTARTAETFITPGFLSSVNLLSPDWRAKHDRIRGEWQRLANTQGATFIYLYRKLDRGYERFSVVMSVMNSSAPYTVFASGSVLDNMPEIYQPAYKKIYEDEDADRAVVTVYREEFGSDEFKSGDHITVLLPIRDAQGGVRAVLGVERQMQELQNVRRTYVRDVLLTTATLLLVALFLYGWYLNRRLLNPIEKITSEALRFARENTHPSVPLRQSIAGSDEIGQLARTIDQMEIDIRDYIEDLTRVTKEKEQIQAELNVATQIQADMLPQKFPECKEFALYATMTPAKEVGGDFYDFFLIDEDHLALVIADVSGKGVPAALFMVIAKTLIEIRAMMGGSPSEILGDVNNRLCEGNEAGLFVTVWLGILEISTGKIAAANAGHEYPAVKRADGVWDLMKAKHSPAVAVREGLAFRESEFELRPGDSLYLYTDGVAEATNAENELYGTARMIEALNRHADEPVEQLLPSMKSEVDAFVGEAPQFDDITMVTLRYFGG